MFYFANWMAWAPLTAMFLGRIAQGYTVRAYIMVNLIIPAMFSILWMSIFGGFALDLEINTPQILKTILDTKGPEHILYAVLDNLPLAGLLAGLICLVSFLSYVTAADSNIDVISTLCLQEAAEETQPRSTVGLKLIWALAVGFAAWIMTTLSGIDGVKMLSNLGGFPALFILITFNIVLIMLGTVKRRDLI